jgi:hypothetical protein
MLVLPLVLVRQGQNVERPAVLSIAEHAAEPPEHSLDVGFKPDTYPDFNVERLARCSTAWGAADALRRASIPRMPEPDSCP